MARRTAGEIEQRDTYFAGTAGRLKLREQTPGESELIQYSRADAAGPRARATSGSCRPRTPTPLREALDAALGTLVVVEKRRRLLLWEGVRIHLDEVEGLGSFIELEAVAEEAGAEVAKVERLRSELEIGAPIPGSYSDLLLETPALLLSAAEAAMRNAYAPHSGFKVGAALRAPSGAIYTGANVENASYPQGQCAETSAIGALVTAGETRDRGGGGRGRADGRLPTLRRLPPAARGVRQARCAGLPGLDEDDDGRRAAPLVVQPRFRPGVSWREASRVLLERAGGPPRVGVVLGSGLGEVADAVEDPIASPYGDLPGFPRPGVEGHAGRAVAGRIGSVPVVALQGRAHLYEGVDREQIITPVRALKAAGAEILVLTNAAGSLRADLAPGSLMLIEDHINLSGVNVLTGPNDDELGPRFPSMRDAYDPDLRTSMRVAAQELGIALTEGVYLAVSGPSFETPAEIRAFHTMGADAVGMSTVHETLVARHCGLRVAGISAITELRRGHGRAGGQPRADAARCRPRRGRPRSADHPLRERPLR